MKVYEINYSTFQANDGTIKNFVRGIRHLATLQDLLQGYEIGGGTITKQQGFWKGEHESSFCLKLVGDYELEMIESLVIEMLFSFNQDSILLACNGNYRFLNKSDFIG